MNFRNTALILFLMGLLAFAFYTTDWFKPKVMRVSYRHLRDQGTVFLLDRAYPLNEVKVLKVSEVKNANPHLLWYMVTTSNTPPVTDFSYGQPINGMHYFGNETKVEPLQPNEKYKVIIRSGKLIGTRDFMLESKTNAPTRPGA
jgi:hypothetical protein